MTLSDTENTENKEIQNVRDITENSRQSDRSPGRRPETGSRTASFIRKIKDDTDALKYLMRSGEKVTISEVSSDLDKLMKIQLQTLALLKRYVGSNDENLINLSKSDARSMYQQFRDHEAF